MPLAWVASISLAFALTGCASVLSPQIFSPTLTGSRDGAAGPSQVPAARAPRSWQEPTVDEAVTRAIALQGQYATAVTEQSQIQPGVGTALIALGAVGLLKGVTGGHPKDIAGAGVVGSAGYLWGSNFSSPPRQRVYLAGIRALGCAVEATRPWAMSDADAKQMNTDLDQASQAASALDMLLRARDADNQPTELIVETPGRSEPAGCARLKKSECPALPPAGPASQLWKEQCEGWLAEARRQCVAVPSATSSVVYRPAPATAQAFQAAKSVLADARSRIRHLGGAASSQRLAGGRLWGKTDDISARVSEEVIKTEPSLGTILGSLANLRDVAFRVSGASLLAPPANAGTAQNGVTRAPIGTLFRPTVDTREIDAARNQLQEAAAKLDPWSARLSAASQQTAAQIDACQVNVSSSGLQVDPDDTDISLAKGQQQVFHVSGGTGVPVGTVSGRGHGVPADLTRELDAQGRYRFTLKVRDSAAPGDEAQVRFSDGAGLSAPRISVHVVAGGSSDGAIVAARNAPEADWKLLGFPAKDVQIPNDFVDRVKTCQALIGDTGAVGVLSDPIRQAFQQGRCSKGPAT